MNQHHFEKWGETVKKMQEPIQKMAALNVETLQNFNYLKPEELSRLKKPEDLLEKQMKMAVENGYKALDYMQKSFKIFEKTMQTLVDEAKKTTSPH